MTAPAKPVSTAVAWKRALAPTIANAPRAFPIATPTWPLMRCGSVWTTARAFPRADWTSPVGSTAAEAWAAAVVALRAQSVPLRAAARRLDQRLPHPVPPGSAVGSRSSSRPPPLAGATMAFILRAERLRPTTMAQPRAGARSGLRSRRSRTRVDGHCFLLASRGPRESAFDETVDRSVSTRCESCSCSPRFRSRESERVGPADGTAVDRDHKAGSHGRSDSGMVPGNVYR